MLFSFVAISGTPAAAVTQYGFFGAEDLDNSATDTPADRKAENGVALGFEYNATSASRSVTLTSAVDEVVVRSRNAPASTGPVNINVVIDGRAQAAKSIPATTAGKTYSLRSWPVSFAAGSSHTIAVRGTQLSGADKLLADNVRLSGPDAPPVDTDGEGIPDETDNCPTVANAPQADLDGDGTGDECDGDRDGDGRSNEGDYDPDDPAVQDPPPPANDCTKTVAVGGSIATVANGAPDGAVVCVRGGIYDQDLRITNNLVTIKSYPGEVAEIRGHMKVNAPDVTLDGMKHRGQYGPVTTGSPWSSSEVKTWPAIECNANRITVKNSPLIENQDPNNPKDRSGQALHIGSSCHGYKVIEVFIGAFGEDDGGNNHQHGIYTGSDDGEIRDNIFSPGWGNGDRCLQLYQDPDRTLVEGNIFDHCNDIALHHSGRGGDATTNTESYGNVIAWTNERFNVNTLTNQVNSTSLFTGNVLHDNCLITQNNVADDSPDSGIQTNQPGFRQYGNVVADPQFDSQHRIKAGTACSSKYTGPSDNTY